MSVKCRNYSKIPIKSGKYAALGPLYGEWSQKMTTLYLGSLSQTEKMVLVHDPQILNTKKSTFRNNDAGEMFHLYCDVTNVILFHHQRAPHCAPLVICNCHRMVFCKHIVLIFSLFIKNIFSYMSLVKSYTQIKRCEQ
jgi:hypothetical protein